MSRVNDEGRDADAEDVSGKGNGPGGEVMRAILPVVGRGLGDKPGNGYICEVIVIIVFKR